MLNVEGCVGVSTQQGNETDVQLTLITSTARNSFSLHVFPTENVPLEFIFDLWMKPSPPTFPEVDYSHTIYAKQWLGVRESKMYLGLRSASGPASSQILM
jgi:hypothetical protein